MRSSSEPRGSGRDGAEDPFPAAGAARATGVEEDEADAVDPQSGRSASAGRTLVTPVMAAPVAVETGETMVASIAHVI